MSIKNQVIIGLAIFAVGLGVGRYLTPSNVTEVEKKETETEKETTDRVITNPDGSKVIEHIVKDTKKEKKENIKTVESKKPSWRVSGLIGYSFDKKQQVYGLDIQKRILGSVSVGIWGTTEKTIGISVGYEF